MKQLSFATLAAIQSKGKISTPNPSTVNLPEKVLQFGTGVLLRGLPDYYIDVANKQGVFNGRIVVVKSTATGGTDDFAAQDGLFTHCIRGWHKGQKVSEDVINASISRVLSASDQWQQVLDCATNPAMEVIISNTTEVGIALVKEDKVDAAPPQSFPGKLLAFLYKRFTHFKGDETKGLVIVPTELIVGNGDKLAAIVIELAGLNTLEATFVEWLKQSNYFCDSLVDRIVPGKLPADEQATFTEKYEYQDNLSIMSEPYGLWAIEAHNKIIEEKLSFCKANTGVVITGDISKFRQLKLRLLNGTHTLTCGLAYLAGFTTVNQAMNNALISGYVRQVMLNEITPTVIGSQISKADVHEFAEAVIDRFSNPFIHHQWLSITLQYSGKIKMRNVPALLDFYEKDNAVPPLMALGFAAYIAFMKVRLHNGKYMGEWKGQQYEVNDDRCDYFADLYANTNERSIVETVLKDKAFWNVDLSLLPGFVQAVDNSFTAITSGDVNGAVKNANRT